MTVDTFLRLACVTYAGGDDVARHAEATAMLAEEPALASESIHAAAAAGDAGAAGRLLAEREERAIEPGGPFGWVPLLYAAYTRVTMGSAAAVATLLLAHGADPNAFFVPDGENRFSALTGAFGYGEDSPNQPPHHESQALGELLLAHGADPNDEQTIYNRHFRTDNDYLALLLPAGASGPMLEDALVFAADDDRYAERIAMLLEHGVNPDGQGGHHPALRGKRPIERALEGGATQIVALLEAAGAHPPETDAVDELLYRALAGDAGDTTHARFVVERFPLALLETAERGNIAGVQQLIALGFDPNGAPHGRAAIHEAAYYGHRDLIEVLMGLGADPKLKDGSFGGDASGWARHAHHDALADWLETL